MSREEVDLLHDLEKRVVWLASFMIHNANNVREKRDGLKVGGHQASSSSLSTIMTMLYFKVCSFFKIFSFPFIFKNNSH